MTLSQNLAEARCQYINWKAMLPNQFLRTSNKDIHSNFAADGQEGNHIYDDNDKQTSKEEKAEITHNEEMMLMQIIHRYIYVFNLKYTKYTKYTVKRI